MNISVSEVLSTNDWDHTTPEKNEVTYKDASGDVGSNPELLLGADSIATTKNPLYIDNGPPPYTEYARMARYIVHYSGLIQRINIKYSIPHIILISGLFHHNIENILYTFSKNRMDINCNHMHP